MPMGHSRYVSWVANVMLSFSIEDRLAADGFSDWVKSSSPVREAGMRPGRGALRDITHTGPQDNPWGGTKYPECNVLAGTLNHGDIEAVVARFAATEWTMPGAAQLLIMDQEQNYFRVWMLRDGLLLCTPPPSEDDGAY
jgi:hypothetical protein